MKPTCTSTLDFYFQIRGKQTARCDPKMSENPRPGPLPGGLLSSTVAVWLLAGWGQGEGEDHHLEQNTKNIRDLHARGCGERGGWTT